MFRNSEYYSIDSMGGVYIDTCHAQPKDEVLGVQQKFLAIEKCHAQRKRVVLGVQQRFLATEKGVGCASLTYFDKSASTHC